LTKVRNVSGYDGHTESSRQVGHATGSGGGGIRHDGNAGSTKQIRNFFFGHVAGKFHARIILETLGYRRHVARRPGMVAAGHYQFHIGHVLSNQFESFEHGL